jgi:hypothetical protein
MLSGRRWDEVRKVLTLVIALLAMSVITPVMASATRTGVTGTISLTATSAGDLHVTKSGILHQVGAQASGPVVSTSAELSGEMEIELNANFNLNTGEGIAFGSFVISGAQGSYEGMFRVWDTGFIHFTGTGEGHGTDAYEGKMVQLQFDGIDLYRDADPSTNGITMTFSGSILSPKGT